MATSKETTEQAVDQIEQTLDDGFSSVTTDGTTVAVDLAQQERRLQKRKRDLHPGRRPVSMRIDLSGGV